MNYRKQIDLHGNDSSKLNTNNLQDVQHIPVYRLNRTMKLKKITLKLILRTTVHDIINEY